MRIKTGWNKTPKHPTSAKNDKTKCSILVFDKKRPFQIWKAFLVENNCVTCVTADHMNLTTSKSWRIEKWKIPNFDQNWPFKRELVTTKVVGGWYQYCLVYISSLFFDKLFFDNFWIAKCYSRRNQKHTRATNG